MAADYYMTAELLASHGIAAPVSEIHGVLSGQICSGCGEPDLDLSKKILDIDGNIEEVITNLLNLLAEDIRKQLGAEDYSFQPLLPEDEQSLSSRLSALAMWCDGFNAGFAGAWVRDDAAMSDETREVLEDFSRIALVEEEDEELPDNENEANLMEIIEYARMATITLYLQNTPKKQLQKHEDLPEDTPLH
jgi:uncharacterized protein YgfB (UPF0149 family)